jgi:hypothetical protein
MLLQTWTLVLSLFREDLISIVVALSKEQSR